MLAGSRKAICGSAGHIADVAFRPLAESRTEDVLLLSETAPSFIIAPSGLCRSLAWFVFQDILDESRDESDRVRESFAMWFMTDTRHLTDCEQAGWT